MKTVHWNPEKNRKLIEERNISFESVVFSLQSGGLLDDIVHPNMEKYLAEYRSGGLGIYMMKTLMDEVSYAVEPGIKTEVKMVKYLSHS